jgi:hypothetical protein
MYLQIKKLKQKNNPRGFDTIITHIGLYKDDWTYVKFIKHNEIILTKLQEAKIDITIPELEWLLNEQEIEKIAPRDPNLFDSVVKWV